MTSHHFHMTSHNITPYQTHHRHITSMSHIQSIRYYITFMPYFIALTSHILQSYPNHIYPISRHITFTWHHAISHLITSHNFEITSYSYQAMSRLSRLHRTHQTHITIHITTYHTNITSHHFHITLYSYSTISCPHHPCHTHIMAYHTYITSHHLDITSHSHHTLYPSISQDVTSTSPLGLLE